MHGANKTYFNFGFIPIGDATNCLSQQRVCNDGVLSGTFTNTTFCQKQFNLSTGGLTPIFPVAERFDYCASTAVAGQVINGTYAAHNFEDFGGEVWDYCTDKSPLSAFPPLCDGATVGCGVTCDLISDITCY